MTSAIDKMIEEARTRNFHTQQQTTIYGRIKHAGSMRKLKQRQRYRKQMKLQRRKR